MTKPDIINLLVTTATLLMAAILTMVEKDRACKNETLRIIWSRRSVFVVGVLTMVYGCVTHDMEGAIILMLVSLNAILSVNIASIVARNHPPLHGHRIMRRVSGAFRRYP